MLLGVTVCKGSAAGHAVLCLNHMGEIHGSFPSQGRNCPAELQQKITAKFNHFLAVSLDFFKAGTLILVVGGHQSHLCILETM